MKPPFPYYGGKQTLARQIVGLLPGHGHYVEPFAGSLAVLLAKPPSRMETVNDLDRELMTFWRVLRNKPSELIATCELTPHSLAEYEACRDGSHPVADAEVARRVWVKLTQGRGSGLRENKTGWRHYRDPAGSSASMPAYLDGYRRRLSPVAERLRGVSLECRPALEVIDLYGVHKDVLLYVDPPYVQSTRNSVGYRHEMTDEDHRALGEALHRCKAGVVLSGYDSGLYRDMFGDWHEVTLPSATGNGGSWEQRTEVIWSNRPLNDGRLFGVTG